MNKERYQLICQHFERLVELDSSTQDEEVKRIAIDDAPLAAELAALLHADRVASSDSFLKDFSSHATETIAFEGTSSAFQEPGALGQYSLEKQLGAGGMGVVYRAFDTIAKRSVAIKLVKPNLIHDEEIRNRTLNEANAAARLSHLNIVPVYDVGTVNDIVYFTMPLLESGDLKSSQVFQYSDSGTTADLFGNIARGLVHAHENGVIHRDIKPSNILLDDNGSPMIADFGLAKNLDNRDLHTETGRLMGSANYMSPEQISDSKNVSELSDMYSFGATLYESLTGRPPFSGNDLIDLFQKINNVKPDRPRDLNPDVDPRLESICLRCLEKQPGDRYESMRVICLELDRVAEGKPLSDRSTSWDALANLVRFRQKGNSDLKTQPASVWVFWHNLITHLFVFILFASEASPILLWILIGAATIHLGLVNWYFHWSRYWHLELTERLGAISLLMVNLCFLALFFIHGPYFINAPVSQFASAYPSVALIFAVSLATHGSIHAGKWLSYAILFVPLSVALRWTDIYAPLIFAVTSSLVTLEIVRDLGSRGKTVNS